MRQALAGTPDLQACTLTAAAVASAPAAATYGSKMQSCIASGALFASFWLCCPKVLLPLAKCWSKKLVPFVVLKTNGTSAPLDLTQRHHACVWLLKRKVLDHGKWTVNGRDTDSEHQSVN